MAYQMLMSAVTTDPGFADGWALLGASCADLGLLAASCEAYRSALRLPDGPNVGDMTPVLRHRCLLQLGHRLINNLIVNEERLDQAEDALHQALDMGADFDRVVTAFCYTNLSLIAAHRGDKLFEMTHAESGFRIHPDPMTELGLAFSCLYQGQLTRGNEHFEARFTHALQSYLTLPWPRWDGGPVDHLIVLSEQGLGDALSFTRFLPEAARRVGLLTYSVQPTLWRLIADATKHIPNIKITPQDRVIEAADAWCPAFSLPTALGLTDAEIRDTPGLTFTVAPVEDTSWKRRDARLHVAIAWAGAPNSGIDMHRSIPFAEFLALRDVSGIALYSVQVGERGADLHNQGGSALVRDLTPWIHEARDTAGIMGEMDLVICCESFVGHLAGALGQRCYLLCSRFGKDWRSSPYLGDKTLWYPETTVMRQGQDATWRPVFKRLVEALSSPPAPRVGSFDMPVVRAGPDGLAPYVTPIQLPEELSK